MTSDFDAVRQLRKQGVDPFQRANVLDLVTPSDAQAKSTTGQMQAATAKMSPAEARVQLPQTVQRQQTLPSTQVGAGDNPADRRAGEIRRIQKDIAKRRRKNIIALMGRLAMFVFLPTLAAGYYFYVMATPMYGTHSQMVIKQAASTGGGGLGSLFQGTGLATQTDSTTVQSYMTSLESFIRLDADHGFTEHFSDPNIDSIQRLASDATRDDAYDVFLNHVQIGYDPTEGFLKMEVIAANPAKSQEFSEALISYAEEQINQQTLRVREDQMSGAQETYAAAKSRRVEALAELVSIQEEVQQSDPLAQSAALQQRITTLEIRLDDERLNLASLLENSRPNAASLSATESEIGLLEDQIALLRGELSGGNGGSLVSNNARLRQAEENYVFQVTNVQATLMQMDTARIEATRQSLYLTISVPPIAPDSPTYPKAFENMLLAFLIFSGIYLMISLTVSILREQVSS
ncbi:putative polysaccharide export protein [Octadecabacter arcticus 238]|uniref:Putative polysaccharide export protein n=1 Tax=Octadecabacter arcticus 238 TaxID=391616 RepID=M9RFV8_9RHOB|nr:putative polysaccharide export protein [Octadecabacter arcticus]AGI71057.1 putative polysaccharide export protein [Octadecabacter arcticus 238]